MIALFVAIEAIDLVTFLQAPHYEANPIMAALPVAAVVAVKIAAVLTVVLLARRLTVHRQITLAIAVAIAAFSVGTNVAMLSIR